MTKPFEGLDENLRMLRELPVGGEFDQEVAELLAKGDIEPLTPPAPPPGTDRASLDWIWAEPGPERETEEVVPATVSFKRDRSYRTAIRIGAMATAASAMFAFGLLLGRVGGDGAAPLLAEATILKSSVRGPGSIDSLRVESRTDARAFLTLVGLVPGRRAAVHYRSDQTFIEVAPRAILDVDVLPESFDGAQGVLVVLSPAPVGEAVRQVAGDLTNAEPTEARESLRAGLSALGYRGFTIEIAKRPSAK